MITKEFEKGRTQAKKEIKNENPFRITKIRTMQLFDTVKNNGSCFTR